jgi:multiple sugar transport system substrate-binding protein
MSDRGASNRVSRRRLLVGGGTLLVLSSIATACGGGAPATPAPQAAAPQAAAPAAAPTQAQATPTPVPTAPPNATATPVAPTATPAPAAQAAPANKPKTVIRYAGLNSMGTALIKYTQDWLDSKNYQVDLAGYDQQGLPEKIVEAAATHTYLADMLQIGPNESIGLKAAGFIREVPTEVLAIVSWDEVVPLFRGLLGYKGKVYALPYDGDCHNAAFRGDIFKDANHQAKFKAKYGYDLDPALGPKDWVQHANYAEYFTGNDWNKSGKKDAFGFEHMTKRDDTAFWGFFSRAAAYAKHPDDKGFFFDLKTMKPRINNPAFVRAVKEWKDETTKWSPPGGPTQTGWGDVIQAFASGRVAMCVGWGDHGTAIQDPTQSKLRGLPRYSMTPGSKEVFNSSSGKWETMKDVSYAPFIAYGGWSLQVPRDSKNVDAAWDWGGYTASLPVSNKMVTLPTGANPIRKSQLQDVTIWTDGPAKWDKDEAASYMKGILDTISHPNAVADLRIQGFFEYVHPLELAVSTVMAGQAEPQAAMDQAAAAWDALNKKFDVSKQRDLYTDAVGG